MVEVIDCGTFADVAARADSIAGPMIVTPGSTYRLTLPNVRPRAAHINLIPSAANVRPSRSRPHSPSGICTWRTSPTARCGSHCQ